MVLDLSIAHIQEAHEALRFEFIVVELDLAMTFCQVAMCTGNAQTATRNIENARRAYQSAEKVRGRIEFRPEFAAEIEQRALCAQSMMNDLA